MGEESRARARERERVVCVDGNNHAFERSLGIYISLRREGEIEIRLASDKFLVPPLVFHGELNDYLNSLSRLQFCSVHLALVRPFLRPVASD